jgi:signal transduction histidine kinase
MSRVDGVSGTLCEARHHQGVARSVFVTAGWGTAGWGTMSVLGTRTGGRPDEGRKTGGAGGNTTEAVVGPEHPALDLENKLHELRASLAGVAGAVHALEGDALPIRSPRRLRIERMLRAEIARLQRLVAPADDQVTAAPEELDLDDVVESVVVARGMAGQEVSWHREGHRVVARRDEIVEILNILLTNAARHAPGVPTHIDVRRDGGQVRIIVSDDGPGVPEELRPAIFDRGAKGPTGGEGIGLSIAKVLAHELGGSLDLKDEGSDRGAVFEVKLPRGTCAGGLG